MQKSTASKKQSRLNPPAEVHLQPLCGPAFVSTFVNGFGCSCDLPALGSPSGHFYIPLVRVGDKWEDRIRATLLTLVVDIGDRPWIRRKTDTPEPNAKTSLQEREERSSSPA